MRHLGIILILIFLLVGCGEEMVSTPKPRMFPRIDFPEKTYEQFATDYCNFTFAKPNYTSIEQDKKYFDGSTLHPCWFDLVYGDFDARIHFSYYPLESKERFEELKKDAFILSQKHNAVANYIDEIPIFKNEFVKGFIFNLEGEVASPIQFYLSDETDNFLRGSLYFNTKSRPDSLAPLVRFVKEDVLKLVETFEWKN